MQSNVSGSSSARQALRRGLLFRHRRNEMNALALSRQQCGAWDGAAVRVVALVSNPGLHDEGAGAVGGTAAACAGTNWAIDEKPVLWVVRANRRPV